MILKGMADMATEKKIEGLLSEFKILTEDALRIRLQKSITAGDMRRHERLCKRRIKIGDEIVKARRI